jgi:type I restriction enzyme, S subunit
MAHEVAALPLDELVDDIIDRRGVTPLKLGSDFTTSGFRVISAKLIKDGEIDLLADEPRFVNEATYRRWMRTPLDQDDVILTSEAPLGEVAYIRQPVEWCVGQRLFCIRTKKDRLHGRFLYYALQSEPVRHELQSRATGTTAQGIRQSELRRVHIPLPPIGEQLAIAGILGAFDDKIELNRRMNETLETMARALFKSWFVDFDPVHTKAEGRYMGLPQPIGDLFPDRFEDSELGEIPEGWGVETIDVLAEVVGGSTPSTSRTEFWKGGTHYWTTPRDLAALRTPVLLDTERQITDAGLAQISSGLLPRGTVLLSSRAPIGYLAIAEVPTAVNQGFIAMKPRGVVPSVFLLHWAHFSMEEIVSRANGSTFLEISKSSFRPMPVVSPPGSVLSVFEELARPFHDRIVSNVREATALAGLRDLLLPRLISGELRAPQPEWMREAASV